MPKGFDIFDGSELLSAFTQGGTIPAEHESQSSFLLMDPGSRGKLRVLVTAIAQGKQIPPGLVRHAEDILEALDNPGQAGWKKAAPKGDGPGR